MADNKIQITVEALNKFDATFKQLSGQIQGLGREIGGVNGLLSGFGTTMRGAVGSLAGIGAAVTSFAGLKSLISGAIDSTQTYAGEVYKLSRMTGLSSESSSELISVSQRLGIQFDTLSTMVTAVARKIGGLKDMEYDVTDETGKSIDVFKKFGIEIKNTDGSIKSFSDVFGQVRDKIRETKNPIEQLAIATQFFRGSAKELMPLLTLSDEKLKELTADAQKYGLVLSGENVAAIREYTLKHRELDSALSGLKLRIGQDLLPTLIDLTNALISFSPKILPGLNSIIAEFVRMGMLLDKIGGTITGIWASGRGAGGQSAANKEFERLYKEKEKFLQDMAMRELGYNPVTDIMRKSGQKFTTTILAGTEYTRDYRSPGAVLGGEKPTGIGSGASKKDIEAANRELDLLLSKNVGRLQEELAQIQKRYKDLKDKGADLVKLEQWRRDAIQKLYDQEDKDTVEAFVKATKNYQDGYDAITKEVEEGVKLFEDKRKPLGLFTDTETALMATEQAIDTILTEIEEGFQQSKNGIEAWKETWDYAFTGINDGFKAVTDRLGTTYDQWKTMAQQTSQAMHQAFSDTFFNAFQGALNNFGDVWKNFWNSMLRIVSDYFATNLTKAFNKLMEEITANVGDWASALWTWIMRYFGRWAGSGSGEAGSTGDTGGYSYDYGGDFGMHQGGYVLKYHWGGLAQDEVPIVAQKGEYILSRKDVDFINKVKSGGPTSVVVNLENNSGVQMTAQARSWTNPTDPEQTIVSIILRNLSRNGDLRAAFASMR